MTMTLGVMADSYNRPASGLPVTAGLIGWWDASDAATITAAAGKVSAWADKSPAARPMTQATGVYQPTTGTATINGKNVFGFVQANWTNMATAATVNVTGPMSIIAVARPATTFSSGRGNLVGYSTTRIQVMNQTWSLAVSVTELYGGTADLNPHVFVGELNGASSRLFVDGVSTVSGDLGSHLVSGTRLAVGVEGNSWTGDIAEVLFYDRVLTTPERQQVESYLTAKWLDPTGGQIPSTGLQLWLDADDASTFTYSSGVVVSKWADKTSSARNGTNPTVAERPTRDGLINARPAVRYSGTQFLYLPAFAGAFTSGEIFMVLDLITENTGGVLGYAWSTSGEYDHYPFSDGNVYECWGSTIRHTLGNPVPDLTQPHILNLRTAAGSYVATINGGALFSTSTNTVGFGAAQHTIVQLGGGSYRANADVGEVIMYNRVLTTPERDQVESYLAAKWLPPWTPASLTGLQLWLDADHAASFTYSSGNNVSAWNDKSSAAHHFNQLPGTAPIRNGSINGHISVVFNTSSIRATSWAMTKPYTVLLVAKNTAGASQRDLWSPNADGRILKTSGGTIDLYQGAFLSTGVQWGATIHSVVGVFNGASSKVACDSNAYVVGNGGTGSVLAGGVHAVGAFRTGSDPWLGDICEVVVMDGEISAADLTAWWAYSKAKWGTP